MLNFSPASSQIWARETHTRLGGVIGNALREGGRERGAETPQRVHGKGTARSVEGAAATGANTGLHAGNVRRMLLAFSRDLRVVLLRLASPLQNLRHYAARRLPVPSGRLLYHSAAPHQNSGVHPSWAQPNNKNNKK